MNNEVNVPEGVKVWWLSCPEHWDVRPVNEAAAEATKLRSEWPTDCDIVALSDLPKVIEQARSQERQRVKEALLSDEAIEEVADEFTEGDEGVHPDFVRSIADALFRTIPYEILDDSEDPEQPEGGDASERGHEAVPSTRVDGPGAGESGSRPETSEDRPLLSEVCAMQHHVVCVAPGCTCSCHSAALSEGDEEAALAEADMAAGYETLDDLSEGVGSGADCILCARRKATQADWDLNGELSDKEAEARGLDNLCWEEEDQSCLALLAESGRPTTLKEALEQLGPAPPPQAVQGESDPLSMMRPASQAHVKLEAAVLRCLEANVWPETIVRFVADCQPEKGGEGR